MDYDKLYRHEVYLGQYRVQWSDQKLLIDCLCEEKDLEIFSDTETVCPSCGRRYSIMEIIKVETPVDEEQEDSYIPPVDVEELINTNRRNRRDE